MSHPIKSLPVTHYEAEAVLVPGKGGAPTQGIRITVYGPNFPIRALQPEILVGDQSAQMVEVSRDQRSIRGYLPTTPPANAVVRVRYGDSQLGELVEGFQPDLIRPLPDDCR